MLLKFKKMILERDSIALQFTTDSILNINPKHFIQLTRPKINLEDIAEGVRHNYTDQIAKGLFSDEIQKKMEKEIDIAIQRKIDRNINLPKPTIFIGNIIEVKHEHGQTTLKLQITGKTAIYIIENIKDLFAMVFELGTYPHYLASSDIYNWTIEECLKVFDIKDNFLSQNPSAIEIEDCFDPLIKFYNEKAQFDKSIKEYKRKIFKYKDDVLYTE